MYFDFRDEKKRTLGAEVAERAARLVRTERARAGKAHSGCNRGLLAQSACTCAMRRQRVNGPSPGDPSDRDDFATTVRINDAVAIAIALPGVTPNPFDESLLRTMLVNMDANATAMVIIVNAGFQQCLYDGMRDRALRRATGRMLRQRHRMGVEVVHALLNFLKVISSRYAANSRVQPSRTAAEVIKQSVE